MLTSIDPSMFSSSSIVYVGKSQNISEANNRGCKHNSARLDKWLEILAVEGLINTERTVT